MHGCRACHVTGLIADGIDATQYDVVASAESIPAASAMGCDFRKAAGGGVLAWSLPFELRLALQRAANGQISASITAHVLSLLPKGAIKES